MKIKNIYIPPGYIVVTIILLIILSGSLLLTSENETKADTTPPILNVLSQDLTVFQGEQAQIRINFSDNVNVTKANLYYRKESETTWKSASIISKSYSLAISEDETKNYHYFITIDDEAGNGPVGMPSTDGSTFYVVTVLKKSNSDENITVERAVFIEEATATWCSNCPEAAEIIHQAYEAQDVPFYYVSMVEDENQKAKTRLETDFSIFGYPSIYMDGGYKVLVGTQNIQDNFNSMLQQASERPAAKIKLTLISEWNDTRQELKNTVYIKNYEQSTYSGTIKVYISEIKSQWTDYKGKPYHFSFLDYAINEPITISAGENKSISETWIASSSGFSVEKQNLWVVAVLFDDESHVAYSQPTSQDDEFDAYYVDATAAARVTEGSLPPTIGLTTPKPFNHYIRGNEGKNRLLSFTYVIGKMTIESNVVSDLAVEKVTIQISGKRTNISQDITEPPYNYVWDQFSYGPHTITATVTDERGRTDSDTIDVWALIL